VGSGLRACAKASEVASVEDEHAERADVPAAHRRDVDAFVQRTTQYPNGRLPAS
jgi:hypothetical protein